MIFFFLQYYDISIGDDAKPRENQAPYPLSRQY